MWKMVLVLIAAAFFIVLARFANDPPVIQTRVGASEPPTLAYAGIRG